MHVAKEIFSQGFQALMKPWRPWIWEGLCWKWHMCTAPVHTKLTGKHLLRFHLAHPSYGTFFPLRWVTYILSPSFCVLVYDAASTSYYIEHWLERQLTGEWRNRKHLEGSGFGLIKIPCRYLLDRQGITKTSVSIINVPRFKPGISWTHI